MSFGYKQWTLPFLYYVPIFMWLPLLSQPMNSEIVLMQSNKLYVYRNWINNKVSEYVEAFVLSRK